MKKHIAVLALVFLAAPFVGYASVVTIAADSTALLANFQSPGTTAQVGYTIQTSDDGTNFNVLLTTTDLTASLFANLYFDTIASTPNTGSNLGFEFGQNSADAFHPSNPSDGLKYSLAGSGITSIFAVNNGVTTATVVIPNSFFLNMPLGSPFIPTPPGTLVSLHLSQSFSYSVVGGGLNFAAPVELGAAIVDSTSAVPEPGCQLLLGIGVCGLLALRNKFSAA